MDGNVVSPPVPWEAIENAAAAVGSPYFIYIPEPALKAYRQLQSGLACWPKSQIAYSLKTNPLPSILTDLREVGSWVEVVSDWEYDIAVRAGYIPETIVFNGPLKSESAIRTAVRKKTFTINIDSREELHHLTDIEGQSCRDPISVGVRVCLPRSGAVLSRFGLQLAGGELTQVLQDIEASRTLRLRCVHFHLGTQVEDLDRYFGALELIRGLWLNHSFGSEVWLDIGGGFPFRHDRGLDNQVFEPTRFFRLLRDTWAPHRPPPIIIEPGRWIAAPALCLVARVLACKPRAGEPSIVVLDAGTNLSVMAAFYEHRWAFQATTSSPGTFRICGPLCMEDDILSGPISGPCPRTGSLVVMMNAGAYSLSLSRSFIQPRPPVVQFSEDGTHRVLVAAESLQEAHPFKALFSTTSKPLATSTEGAQA